MVSRMGYPIGWTVQLVSRSGPTASLPPHTRANHDCNSGYTHFPRCNGRPEEMYGLLPKWGMRLRQSPRLAFSRGPDVTILHAMLVMWTMHDEVIAPDSVREWTLHDCSLEPCIHALTWCVP